MFKYSFVIGLLMLLGVAADDLTPEQIVNEWKDLYSSSTLDKRNDELKNAASSHLIMNDKTYVDDHWQYVILGDVVDAWQVKTGLKFNQIEPKSVEANSTAYGSTELTQDEQDTLCVAGLYHKTSNFATPVQDRCKTQAVWAMFARFARCTSRNFINTDFGHRLLTVMAQHIDTCKHVPGVTMRFALENLRSMMIDKTSVAYSLGVSYEDEHEKRLDAMPNGDPYGKFVNFGGPRSHERNYFQHRDDDSDSDDSHDDFHDDSHDDFHDDSHDDFHDDSHDDSHTNSETHEKKLKWEKFPFKYVDNNFEIGSHVKAIAEKPTKPKKRNIFFRCFGAKCNI